MSSHFAYKAVSSTGKHYQGEFVGESKEQVAEHLTDRELIPVSIVEKKESTTFAFLKKFDTLNYEDLIMFTNNLSTMYRAGIPLLRALSIIKIGKTNSLFNQAIPQIHADVQAGKSLSEAMLAHPKVFSKVYISSIAAGEESGKLDEILDQLAKMLEREMEINRLIKSGLRYPIIVMIIIALAFTIVMTYVIPKFTDFYASFDSELPLPTQIMITMSNFITGYWWAILGLLGVIIYTYRYVRQQPKGKLAIDTAFLKLPVFGELIIKGNVARFALMFQILYKSGLPIIKSLDILSHSVANSMVQQEIDKLGELFRRGSENQLLQTKFFFFPDLAKQMISIGLESGALERMLLEVGEHYSKEVQYTSRHLTAILEPILTVVISGFVLLMALAIFMPMWNLIKVFNG